jgi:cell wall-associated NlpC family hydrolase
MHPVTRGYSSSEILARIPPYEQARAAPSPVTRPVVPPSTMPTRLRSLLLAFALVAFASGCGDAVRSVNGEPAVGFASGAAGIDRPTRPVPPAPTLGERAATMALKEVGVPYRWGGASPTGGFDCSGLVYWAYGRLGVELPHSSYALYDLGRYVPRSKMATGDLLFFSGLGHVGIYIGRGRMVHAPYSGRTVEVVTLGRSYYGSRLIGVRRVVLRSRPLVAG